MGCSSSKPKASKPHQPDPNAVTGQMVVEPIQPTVDGAVQPTVDGQMIAQPTPTPIAPAAGRSSGKGKGKGKGGSKGKGRGKGGPVKKFQIFLSGKWKDYGPEEDGIMKRAYMTGQKKCKFNLRSQYYEYDFTKMAQINKETRKHRQIRVPWGGPKPPAKPILPEGPATFITVKPGQAATVINISDPSNPGNQVPVYVPPHAKPGAKMAVPLPGKGQTVEKVQQKQEKHDKANGSKTSKSSWTTGGKVAGAAAATAAVGVCAVGGVILGDHLAGGEMAESIGAAAVEIGEPVVDAAEDAVDAVADWAPGAADDIAGAAEDAGEWVTGAAEDVGEWTADAFEDAGEWLGDAADDTGDFFMDLF